MNTSEKKAILKELSMDKGFAIIPNDVLFSTEISEFQKRLYCIISGLTQEKGYCWASNPYLAVAVGKSTGHVSKTINDLIRKEILFVTEKCDGGRERRIYTVITFVQYAKENGIDITKMIEAVAVKNRASQKQLRGLSKTTKGLVKNDKHNSISDVDNVSSSVSKDTLCASGESLNNGTSLVNKSIYPRIDKKNNSKSKSKSNTLDPKNKTLGPKKKTPKSKYKKTDIAKDCYERLISRGIGITEHKDDSQAKLNSIDKLHALLSKKLENPYQELSYVPEEYIDFEWDLGSLIEVFKYHLRHAEKSKQKKSIGDFIFTKGFNGHKSWSPLILWGQKLTRTLGNELTEEGNKLFKSLSHRKIKGLVDLDSSIINKVSADILRISEKYVFVDNGTSAMNYPMGITSVVSKYIKEKTNNRKYKLVYITKNGFIEKEFIPEAISRNILKKKHRGININA